MLNLIKFILIFSLLWLQLNAHNNESRFNVGNLTKPSNNNGAELIFAHVLWRHGDRNPLDSYKNDLYKDPKLWPRGYGSLTNIGMQQHYELGKYLRRRYQSILGGDRYINDIVYVRSTDIERTLMSAASNLAALFPPEKEQQWNQNISWQPTPIHTIPENLDELFFNGKPCPRFQRETKRFMESNEFTSLLNEYKPLFKYLNENAGIKMNDVHDVLILYNTLYIQTLKNRTLPDWTRDVFVEGGAFQWLGLHDFLLPTNTPLLARLSTGFLIREMLERFTQKIESKLIPNRSLWIYSAHDIQICNILNYLGIYELHHPPYASSLHFELYKKDEQFYMQFFYKNSTDEYLAPLNIPSCGTKCPIEKFYEIYKDLIPTGSYDEECQLKAGFNFREPLNMISMAVLVIILPLLIFMSWKLYSSKRRPDGQKPEHLKCENKENCLPA